MLRQIPSSTGIKKHVENSQENMHVDSRAQKVDLLKN